MEESESYHLHIAELVSKYLMNALDAEGIAELERWIGAHERNAERFTGLLDEGALESQGRIFRTAGTEEALIRAKALIGAEMLPMEARPEARAMKLWPRIAVAAAAVAAIAFGIWFFTARYPEADSGTSHYATEIAPGKQGATLTLANGKKIRLSDARNGQLADEDGVTITKTADGQLNYVVMGDRAEGDDQMNTLSTARGETYMVTLPDQSKVWLNAFSSITYAARMNERGLRKVQLAGEAYFQVAKDKQHPFIVESKGQQVEVLGTHFNISAYPEDRQITTTLEEGRVKVTAASQSEVLRPNQQAVLSGKDLQVKDVDAEYALAWKNGYFLFNDESLESVMAKVARWYNVDVEFLDESVKSRAFIGTVSRFEKISEVFHMLEKTNVAVFRLDGRKVIIDKKK